MKLKTLSLAGVMGLGVSALAGCAGATPAPTQPATAPTTSPVKATSAQPAATAAQTTATSASLNFPADNFTTQTVTVTTASGSAVVEYRLYQHIPYVSKPVDLNYQSLDVKVPVSINGKAIDATNAPMLLVINVGGYMSVNNASGGAGVGAPVGGIPGGAPPAGARPGGMMGGNSGASPSDLGLASGFVVVVPGVRGRDNKAADGTYFGKAPAAIVDLKAAVRYIRYNDKTMPGNAEMIVSRGTSAGGALSALLGASSNSPLYDGYLKEIGAAEASDAIYASADFCPITDLEHADMAYEWEFGGSKLNGQVVDQTLSKDLASAFPAYLSSLNLQGANNFGALTPDNYKQYLLKTYLIPSATAYLAGLAEDKRAAYLQTNPWITWANNIASFSFDDFLAHVGRSKGAPSFDKLDLSAAENILFGTKTANARHFTAAGAQKSNTSLDVDIANLVNVMNPMYFIAQNNAGMAKYWWIRQGSSDTDTALPVLANLATSLQNKGKDVNALLYWDAGHGADQDSEAMMAWISKITGYTAR